jgi:hypothetical protein
MPAYGRRRPLAALTTAATLALGTWGCDSETPRPPLTVVTPAPVRGVIAQSSFSNFEPDVWVSVELILSQKGALDVAVDWTFPDSWIYVYLGRTKCDYQQLSSGSCPFLVSSETQLPKPRGLVTAILEPGTYYLVLYNVPKNRATGVGSDNTESVSFQLGLTVFADARQQDDAVRLGRIETLAAPPRLVEP